MATSLDLGHSTDELGESSSVYSEASGDVDFEDLYRKYSKPKKNPVLPKFNSEFEDITQITTQWGSVEVFKTTDTQTRDRDGKKRPSETKFSDLQLEIQSPALQESMRQILKGFTSISLEKNPIVIPEPFAELYFCRHQIQSAIEKAQSPELMKELQLLVNFREKYMAKTISTIETSIKEGKIESENLWCLFPVGSVVILQNRHTPGSMLIWCVVVKSCDKIKGDRNDEWAIRVEFSGFDGEKICRAKGEFNMGHFYGSKEIRSLKAYPLDFHPQKEEVKKALIERGKRYVELCLDESQENKARAGYHCSYTGPFWCIKEDVVNFFEKPTKKIAGEEVPSKDLMITPPTIVAYSLSLKTWGMVRIDTLTPIDWSERVWGFLQLDAEKKTVVRGLIESHHDSSSEFDDFIPGKGRGLVFLLYGPPGCGKTMTAESAAESLHRPLYYFSGAELGIVGQSRDSVNAESVEAKLELIFKRTSRWKALLLLDEADVFITSRGGPDSTGTRNALTSVLLRLLEYQSGIIFLTTNRLLDFDKAVFSRVHVTLSFEALSAGQRRFIWEHMAEQTKHEFSDSDFSQLSLLPLDGRTIKNILRTASLHLKVRGKRERGACATKMRMIDIKAVLRFAIGDLDNEELQQKLSVHPN
ncbi:P-loop containing nucleoside triphosphate hydrolase protein [Thozetella sp. PMI_491]|nr:P-loop containing nucleoside triphosphate hydrolase protein [Thozetella sp. PMI_491]